MKPKKRPLPWRDIWAEFDKWCQARDKICGTCKRKETDYPEWDEQQNKIRQLVEAARNGR